MPGLTANVLTLEVSYGVAIEALNRMTDDELIAYIDWPMVSFLSEFSEASWRPNEPEHEFLGAALRRQIRADLDCAYAGHRDGFCDEHLAVIYANGLTSLIAVWSEDADPEDCPYIDANPVCRLNAVGITQRQPEQSPQPTRLQPGGTIYVEMPPIPRTTGYREQDWSLDSWQRLVRRAPPPLLAEPDWEPDDNEPEE